MKERRKKNKISDKSVKIVAEYLQNLQNGGEQSHGIALILDYWALYLLEIEEKPIEEVAKVFVKQRIMAFKIIARFLDKTG